MFVIKLREIFDVKHILFAVVLIAVMMFFALSQSFNMVKVIFNDDNVYVKSDKYSMTISYEDIVSAELVTFPDAPGTEVADTFDDGTLLAGTYRNDVWGEYSICADPDASVCIVVRLTDGRCLVFSRKSDVDTALDYEELLTHLPNA